MTDFREQIAQHWAISGPWVFALLLASILDLLGGLTVAFGSKQLDSTISRHGVARKLLMLLVCAFFALIDGFLPSIPVPVIGQITWAGMAAVWWLVTEGLSLAEKCAMLGVPLNPRLVAALKKVGDIMTPDPFRFGDTPNPDQSATAVAVAVAVATPDPVGKEI